MIHTRYKSQRGAVIPIDMNSTEVVYQYNSALETRLEARVGIVRVDQLDSHLTTTLSPLRSREP